jgi:hypothetical protein
MLHRQFFGQEQTQRKNNLISNNLSILSKKKKTSLITGKLFEIFFQYFFNFPLSRMFVIMRKKKSLLLLLLSSSLVLCGENFDMKKKYI